MDFGLAAFGPLRERRAVLRSAEQRDQLFFAERAQRRERIVQRRARHATHRAAGSLPAKLGIQRKLHTALGLRERRRTRRSLRAYNLSAHGLGASGLSAHRRALLFG